MKTHIMLLLIILAAFSVLVYMGVEMVRKAEY